MRLPSVRAEVEGVPMRVFTCAFGTETNTFAPFPTGRQAFQDGIYFPPGAHPDEITEFTVPLMIARRRGKAKGWNVREGTCAFASPGGLTTRKVYEEFRVQILAELEAALPVDVIALSLHGAMVADGYTDCEGDLLTHMRRLAGPDTIIGAELDAHGHLSQAMAENSDILVFFKEYPHTDFIERGEELLDLLEAAHRGTVRPVMSVYDCRMIGAYHTNREPMRSFVSRMKAYEREPKVLSVSLAHSFPWADIPEMGTKVLVITDNEPERGAQAARTLGRDLFALRGSTRAPTLTIGEALARAERAREGPVIIADCADNPGAGCGGDSTYLLRAVLERGMKNVAFAPFYDPGCVQLAFEAGENASLKLRLGGKMSELSGDPLDVRARIVRLNNALTLRFAGTRIPAGRAAAIRLDGVEIVLLSHRTQALEPDIFEKMGIAPGERKVLVLKSSQHFTIGFAPVAKEILYVDAPGTAGGDLTALPFRHISRPKWPFDSNPFECESSDRKVGS